MGPGTTIRAIANGHKAASGMLQYLEVVAPAEVPAAKAFIHSDAEGIKVTQGLKIAEVALKDRQLEVEDSFSPSAAEAVAEASRCLNCGCYAVSPSDIAPTLVALSAKIVTNKRTLAAEAFFEVNTLSNTSLEYDEIITEIQVPALPKGAKSYYKKLAFRKAIDFPVVSVAVVTGDAPRVVLGAVAPTPYRAVKAEKILAGKAITEDLAEQAGAAALEDAHPFEATAYKIQIGKTLVKRALLATV
jgi:CO/xanthine dehydrogenase FAD-binding subunit